ncbi:MAG: ATP-binding protein [Phycisphaerae bacterium]|jgi:hypothetical protein
MAALPAIACTDPLHTVQIGRLEDWGKLIGDVPSATAILDRFLHHAEIITINGRSYRLKDHPSTETPARSRSGKQAVEQEACQEPKK